MKNPETLAHGRVGNNECPMCGSAFSNKKDLHQHLFNTRKHQGVVHELWRLRFLLEEAERDKKILRGQRDEWRRAAKELH